MARDPWHYPRRALAKQFLARFDPGPAQALTLFAARRSGKTAFLQNDLAVYALEVKLQPLYIDLWAARSDPGKAIADGFEAAARKVKAPGYNYGSILGRFDDQVTSFGALGFSVAMKPRAEVTGPADALSRIAFWSDQLVSASKRPILLLIDEVQAMAGAENGVDIASALRAALQKHGRMAVRPVFTGSSRDGLNRMFNQSNAAFFQYGASPDFPSPDDGIARFFADRLKSSSGICVPPADLLLAFNALDRRPGPFRDMVAQMDNAADADVEKYLQRQIGALQAMTRARVAKITPVEHAVLEQVLLGNEVFGEASKTCIAGRLGVPAVNNKTLNDALTKLRASGLVTRRDRGEYVIEDHDVAALVGQTLPADS